MNADIRDKWVHVKVTAAERESWAAFAKAQGFSVSDLVRQMMATAMKEPAKLHAKPRRISRRADPELIRELAKVGNNLNQIARWANTYKTGADAREVTQALIAIERALSHAR